MCTRQQTFLWCYIATKYQLSRGYTNTASESPSMNWRSWAMNIYLHRTATDTSSSLNPIRAAAHVLTNSKLPNFRLEIMLVESFYNCTGLLIVSSLALKALFNYFIFCSWNLESYPAGTLHNNNCASRSRSSGPIKKEPSGRRYMYV